MKNPQSRNSEVKRFCRPSLAGTGPADPDPDPDLWNWTQTYVADLEKCKQIGASRLAQIYLHWSGPAKQVVLVQPDTGPVQIQVFGHSDDTLHWGLTQTMRILLVKIKKTSLRQSTRTRGHGFGQACADGLIEGWGCVTEEGGLTEKRSVC